MHLLVKEHRFPDAVALAHALASGIAVDLKEALAVRMQASLVVSGGRTPEGLFRQLSLEALDWDRVTVTLADERWVEPAHQSSNERLVREQLLAGRAARAPFVGLKNRAATAEAGLEQAWRAVQRLCRPFDVVVLGMGQDGHTASLFPGPRAAAALDPSAPPGCVATLAPSVPRERISLNLAALLDARRIVLQIGGAEKWEVYRRALEPGPVAALPVRGVLHQQQVPVDVFWSP